MLLPTREVAPEDVEGSWEQRTLSSFVVSSAANAPDQLALVEGDIRLDYQHFAQLVAEAAGGLRRRGFLRHDVLTIELPNWWEASVLSHAAIWSGGVINPVTPIYRRAELEFIVTQANSRVMIVPHTFRGFDYVTMMSEIIGGLDTAPLVVVVRAEGELPRGFIRFEELFDGETLAEPLGAPEDICVLLYTSGTTSAPKGVLHSHQTMLWELRSIVDLLEIGPESTIFMASPVGHLTGLQYGILMPPMLGRAGVLLDVWDPVVAATIIEREGCTFALGATPFLQGLRDEYRKRGTSSSLTTFLCGGADIPHELVRTAQTVFGAWVARSYGSTEVPVFCASGPRNGVELAVTTDGLPVPPAVGHLIDIDSEIGELVVKGPEMFLGYLDGSLNAAAFTDDGFFRTGDLAKMTPEGAIQIVGRSKDIIIRNGENISAREVEEHLEAHDTIVEASVVAVPDPTTGEKAFAFLVGPDAAQVTLADLRTFLDARGLSRQKIPEYLRVVDELPRTPSGKVQKFVLRDWAKQALATP